MGDDEAARLSGLRRGNFDSFDIPSAEEERIVAPAGLAYGLGLVRLIGLKLWPVSTSEAFVELFHFGRVSVEVGRGMRFPTGVAEPSRVGMMPRVDMREASGLRGSPEVPIGIEECLLLLGGCGR
jgi:hypothetical protein